MLVQTTKAWHILDESKSKYFLVDVINRNDKGQKCRVQFNTSIFQVPSVHVLPYEVNKPTRLQQLSNLSSPEILDWIIQNGGQSSWVRLNSKVVLDLDHDTAEKRFQHVCYLMGRFLVSFRKKQYFYVSNDKIGQTNCHTIHQMIIKMIAKTTNLWPYAVSLDSIGILYNICFSGLPIKFKTYIKQSEIIQMSIIPFKCDSKDLFVEDSINNNQFFIFKSQIFAILQSSTRQSKRYFRIPDKSYESKSHSYNAEYLVDRFLQIGLKIDEINHLIAYFAVILNLNQLQLVNVKKGGDYIFKIKEPSMIKQNLNSLLGEQLVQLLQKELNRYNQNRDEMQDVKIKLEIIMSQIFHFGIEHIAYLLNSKMININSCFDSEVRQFIYVQFPAVGQNFQESPQNYLIASVNQFIKEVALKTPHSHPIQWYSSLQSNHGIIKQLYGYDINKGILKYLNKKMSWSQQLKNGEFIVQFKKNRLKKQQFDERSRQFKISQLFQEIQSLRHQDDSTFINFLIRSEQTSDGHPRKQIIDLIKAGIEQKKLESSQEETANNANFDEQYIQLLVKTFQERYQYCQMTKSIFRLKLQIFDGLEIYFKKSKKAGRIAQINEKQVVFLTIPTFNELEKQRNLIESKSNRIKTQFKRFIYRKQFLKGVHQSFIKITFFKWLRDKNYALLQQSILLTRIRAAIKKMDLSISGYFLRMEKRSFEQLRKRCSISKIKSASQSFKPKTVEGLQIKFLKDLQEIKNTKKRQEGALRIKGVANNYLQIYYNQLIQGLNQQNKKYSIVNGVQKIQNYQIKKICKSLQPAFKALKNNIRVDSLSPSQNANIQPDFKQTTFEQKHKERRLPPSQQAQKEKLKSEPQNQRNKIQNLKVQQNKHKHSSLSAQNSSLVQKSQKQQLLNRQQHLKAQQNKNQNISLSPSSAPLIQNSPTNSANQMPMIYINEPISQQPVSESTQIQGPAKNSQSENVPKNMIAIKEQQNQQHNGDNTDRFSNAPSSVGFQKSQTSRPITKQQLYAIRDNPKFSFDTWAKESIGFLKRKPIQPEDTSVVKLLFNKPQLERPPNKEPDDEQNVDILIKQKIVVNPFFPYLIEHIKNQNEQNLQKTMSHQSGPIKQPLLKKFPLQTYPKVFQETFNNILKIGKDKNTTKSRLELIKQIIKPITQSLAKEAKNVRSVFDHEVALVIDYSWNHNIIKDEIFLQFIKQIMMNEKQESLKELITVLQVITRYYYPSIQFIYSFLHYLKSLQSKNIQKLNQCFINTLMFAQAFQKYKGNNVTVLKDQILPKEKESYNRLMVRKTEINQLEIDDMRTITLRLFNQQKFVYKVRNENLSHFKRKLLKTIKLIHYEDYFAIYIMRKQGSGMIIFNEEIKGIDFLSEYQQNLTDNILYVRLKVYFPFNLKEINKTRILYLNSLVEEKNLPWLKQNYENVVALAMLFDQFEQYRISNFLIISHQANSQNVDISPIQNKYSQLVAKPGQKVCELQYFRLLKQNDFIAAKCYQVRDNVLSPLGLVTKIVIKPLELAFYQDNQLKSSVSLKRIKSYYLDKGTIGLDLQCPDQQSPLGIKVLTIQGAQRVSELYTDLTTYINYLNQK